MLSFTWIRTPLSPHKKKRIAIACGYSMCLHNNSFELLTCISQWNFFEMLEFLFSLEISMTICTVVNELLSRHQSL